jgi:hypothetical protein
MRNALCKALHNFFRALKSSGFNIEDTHLTDIDRIDKLFALVIVAFTWAYIVGIYAHKYVKQIETKKHGRIAKSLFKYGLGMIANFLLNPKCSCQIDIFNFLSCT